MRRNKRRIKGIASIEFALGFVGFWLMCMLWVEMSYMSFVSAVTDITISEAARQSKKSEDDYDKIFQSAVNRAGSVWGNVIDKTKLRMSVQYLASVKDLESHTKPCKIPDKENIATCGVQKNSAIAVYRLDYRFSPMLTYFSDTSSLFLREVIVIQEYERDKFKH
ncbi:putative TadE-like protein [Vibrio nigripulchritudo SOn1]|uniref:TadE-like protein n=1 Tax=Vibrio nigripulchritudo SOn1 TaxID=1238450 RepID=A0AAV2VZL4_9VIBR|nr:TadE family protein [Vibrio nigripulchritudo]KJY74788.1 pilus assembly protein TadE [Vibrio nigripulchritudo]CCO49822.1 putative TadE-like protein [Vibrio nigripulchritudo SOn1]